MREANDGVKVSAVAGEIDVLASNGEVLEVVASTRLNLEMARVGTDGGLEVGDGFARGGPERGGVLLETVQLGDDCERALQLKITAVCTESDSPARGTTIVDRKSVV